MKTIERLMVGGAVLLLLGPAAANGVIVTFEEGLGRDLTPINPWYRGISFDSATGGVPLVYADVTTGGYRASSWPSGQKWNEGYFWVNDFVAAFTTASGGAKIAFDNQDASYVQVNYSSGFLAFNLEAYDSNDVLLGTDDGPANRRKWPGLPPFPPEDNENGPGTLRVDAPVGKSIAYALVHDAGGFWLIDNVDTDATGIQIIPEPASLIVWSILAIVGIAGRRWRRQGPTA